MVKSKAWNWDAADAPWWKEPASEVYPLLNRWQEKGHKKLLDLGCGLGRHSIFFAQNGFNVSAIDLSREGIKKLEALAKQKNLSIHTKIGDMLSLPYKDDSFDCLLAYHVIYHADSGGIRKTIDEIKRVLVNNGEAFITFNSKNSSAFKNPDNKRLDRNTIIKTQGHEADIPHYYTNKTGAEDLLKDFEILDFFYKENYYPGYTHAHYFALVKNKVEKSLKETLN